LSLVKGGVYRDLGSLEHQYPLHRTGVYSICILAGVSYSSVRAGFPSGAICICIVALDLGPSADLGLEMIIVVAEVMQMLKCYDR
jgi:hypothetical protein